MPANITQAHIDLIKKIVRDALIDSDVRANLLLPAQDVAARYVEKKFEAVGGKALVADFPLVRFRPIRSGQALIVGPEQDPKALTIFLPIEAQTYATAIVGTGFPDASTPETSGCPPIKTGS